MKKVKAKNLNSNQKVWLADRYLTYQCVDNLKYGDYTELKNELNNDIANFIYNLAYFSVKFGVIKEYFVYVEFDINGYEVIR